MGCAIRGAGDKAFSYFLFSMIDRQTTALNRYFQDEGYKYPWRFLSFALDGVQQHLSILRIDKGDISRTSVSNFNSPTKKHRGFFRSSPILALYRMGDNYQYYHYDPSMAAAIIFAAAFLLSTGLHMYQMISTKTWYLTPLIIGGFC